ncbi:MAG: hypothetical protein JST48_05015 [Bacteroidetes bacterium]|nr:hypothetical protein [Bacteroidota bacterium]
MFSTLIKSRSTKIIGILFSMLIHVAHGQILQTGRIEKPIQNNGEAYSIVSLDTAGLLLYRNFIGETQNQTELIRLDTALQQKWRGFFPSPKTTALITVKSLEKKIWFFFMDASPKNREFKVYAVNAKDGKYQLHTVKTIIAFNPTHYVATKQAILIGGYFNFRPLVLFYSLRDKKSHILPGFLNEVGELTQIQTRSDGAIDVVVSAKNVSSKKCLWIRQFDSDGNLLKTLLIEPAEKKNLIFGRIAKADSGNQVIAGVYGRSSLYSRGVFVADVNLYGEYGIHYYSFAELQNFFHYMKAKREKRIKDRIARRRVKGKKTKFNYRLLVHELISIDGQFILLGEAFYPEYTTPSGSNNFAPWSFGGNSRYYSGYQNNNLIFDGFRYTHAVAIGFDKKGELAWDNSFEISGIKSYDLKQFVKIVPRSDHIVLLYLYENQIRSKIIKGNQVLEGSAQSQLKTFNSQDQAKQGIRESKLEYWFGNRFFVSGIQFLKSNEIASETRKVFFINKIEVQ